MILHRKLIKFMKILFSQVLKVLVVILCSTQLFAQSSTPEMFVAGVRIYIGIEESKVIKSISSSFTIKETEKKRQYLIFEPTPSAPFNVVATLFFEKGVLVRAMRKWADGNAEMEFAQILHNVMSYLTAQGEKTVTIETGSQQQPNFKQNFIRLDTGKRIIDISISEFKGSKTLGIDEIIGAFPGYRRG